MPKENVSLLDLPVELLLQILSYVLGGNDQKWVEQIIDKKAVSRINKDEGTPSSSADKNFNALSHTCRTFRNLLAPYRLEVQARELLRHILEGNETQTLKRATLFPELLFRKVTGAVKEYAAGLAEETNEDGQVVLKAVHREFCNIMPLRALMVVKDGWMLTKLLSIIEKYVDKATGKSGLELAFEQWQAQFPNSAGLEYPPSTFDFSDIVNAITADQQLRNTGQANPDTQAALKSVRERLIPRRITEKDCHHHVNMNDLIQALKVYDDNWDPWNGEQRSYFWCGVVGGIQRVIWTNDAQWICEEGLAAALDKKQGSARGLKVYNWVTSTALPFFPLDSNPACRLGVHFGVVNYGAHAHPGAGGVHRANWGRARGAGHVIGEICRAKTAELDNFRQHIEQSRPKERENSRIRCIIL